MQVMHYANDQESIRHQDSAVFNSSVIINHKRQKFPIPRVEDRDLTISAAFAALISRNVTP